MILTYLDKPELMKSTNSQVVLPTISSTQELLLLGIGVHHFLLGNKFINVQKQQTARCV